MFKQSRNILLFYVHLWPDYRRLYMSCTTDEGSKSVSLDSETETGDRHEDVKIELEKNEGTMQIQNLE